MPLVRYVGIPDPVAMDLEKVRRGIRLGLLTEDKVRYFNYVRMGGANPLNGQQVVQCVIPGVTWRELGPNEGLSRTVRWGPHIGTFIQEVSQADWEAIQRLPEAAQWVIVADWAAIEATAPIEADFRVAEAPAKTFNVIEETERRLRRVGKTAEEAAHLVAEKRAALVGTTNGGTGDGRPV